jgi:predicted regulator of Ras-like GTPase activity (Roadblock/LC7/MglB family)
MNDQTAQYYQMLEVLYKACNLEAIVLTDMDGRLIAKILPPSSDIETIGSVVTTTLTMVQSIIREMGRKEIKQFLAKGKSGFILLRPILNQKVLMVFAPPSMLLSTLFLEVDKLATNILQLHKPSEPTADKIASKT